MSSTSMSRFQPYLGLLGSDSSDQGDLKILLHALSETPAINVAFAQRMAASAGSPANFNDNLKGSSTYNGVHPKFLALVVKALLNVEDGDEEAFRGPSLGTKDQREAKDILLALLESTSGGSDAVRNQKNHQQLKEKMLRTARTFYEVRSRDGNTVNLSDPSQVNDGDVVVRGEVWTELDKAFNLGVLPRGAGVVSGREANIRAVLAAAFPEQKTDINSMSVSAARSFLNRDDVRNKITAAYKLCPAVVRGLLEGQKNPANLPLSPQLSAGAVQSNRYVMRNGELVDTSSGQSVTELIKAGGKPGGCCKLLGLDGKSEDQCTGFLTQCLRGNNISECKDFMEDENFWVNAMSTARNTNPVVIKSTFKKFNIAVSSNGSVQDLNEWSRNMESKHSVTVGAKLRGWLGILKEVYTSNPAIGDVDRPSQFNSGWSAFLAPAADFANFSPSSVQGTVQTIGLMYATPGIRMASVYNKNQAGGSERAPDYVVDRIEESLGGFSHLMPNEAGNQLTHLYDGLKERLGSVNKTISAKDDAQIKQLLTQFTNSEAKLHQSLRIADKYLDLLDLGYGDDSEEVNVDHLNSFVEQNVRERANKLEQQSKNLGAIFIALSKTITQEGGSKLIPPFKYF